MAMNADGSSGVSVDARLGARVSSLRAFAIGLLAAGALLLLVGGSLRYRGIRRPVSHRQAEMTDGSDQETPREDCTGDARPSGCRGRRGRSRRRWRGFRP